MSYKEKEEMKNIMICKNKERETMRFRGFLERLLNIPFSEKQNIQQGDSMWMRRRIRIPVECISASGFRLDA